MMWLIFLAIKKSNFVPKDFLLIFYQHQLMNTGSDGKQKLIFKSYPDASLFSHVQKPVFHDVAKFLAKSNFVPKDFLLEKVDFSETILACDLKLIHLMEICE